MDALGEYYKDITFSEFSEQGGLYDNPKAKCFVTNNVDMTIIPTDNSIHLTYHDLKILSYSFLDYLVIGCTQWYPYIEGFQYSIENNNYYGIPVPIFPTNLTLRVKDDPIEGFSFLDGELFNIPINDSVFQLIGKTLPNLPPMNIQSKMRIDLFSSLHISEVIKETFQYPLLHELTLVVYDEIPIDKLLKIQLPLNLKTFNFAISNLYNLILPQAFLKNILSNPNSLVKFKFYGGVKLTDGCISILKEYDYHYERGAWVRD